MSAAVKLVSKYLNVEQKAELALNLAADLDNPENSAVLSELIAHLDLDTIDRIYPEIFGFTKKAALSGSPEKLECALPFIGQLEKLSADILSVVHAELSHETTNRFKFVDAFASLLPEAEIAETGESSGNDLASLFAFLAVFYSKASIPSTDEANATDQLLCLFLGHKDDAIAASVSKIIRWRICSIVAGAQEDPSRAQYLWDIVLKLIEGESKRYQTNAYIMWLRVLSSGEFKNDDFFQKNVINQDFYWQLLQDGLVQNSHEIRKFCLSILQLSLKGINTTIETRLLSWKKTSETSLLAAWSRYTTLFEILGIDTSLHQTQAAVNDIHALISKDSLIHPSWGFCLLSTGFQASMDSVRKYSMEILLSVESEDLSVMRHSLPFLEKTFLPYMMLARHFAVRPASPLSNDVQCAFGDQYCLFLSNIIKSLTTAEDIGKVAHTLLKVLVHSREAFDAVRIYTALGLLRGLRSSRVLEYGVHDQLLVKLFDDFSEGALYKTAVQTLNLRLMLHFRLDSIDQFVQLAVQFNSFNGPEIFSRNVDRVAAYISECGFTKASLVEYGRSCASDDLRLIAVWILTSPVFGFETECEELVLLQSGTFVCLLVECGVDISLSPGIKERIEILLKLASNNRLPGNLSESLAQCKLELAKLTASPGDLTPLYSAIKQDVQSSDYGTLVCSHAKLKYLSRCVASFGSRTLPLSTDELQNLKKLLFCNSAACVGTVSDFYKLRANVFGEFHALIAAYVALSEISPEQYSEILGLLTFGSSHFSTLYSIASTVKVMLDRGLSDDLLEKSVSGLYESFTELNSERLRLSDKDLHFLLVEVMLHPLVLARAAELPSVEHSVASFCNSMLTNAQGRRGLSTRLLRALSDFQVSAPSAFEQLLFVPDFLVRAACHRQLHHSAFRLESVVGKLYDAELGTDSSIYEAVYGAEEVAARVWTTAMLSSVRSPECSKAILDKIFKGDDEFRLFNIVNPVDGAEDAVRSVLVRTALSVVDNLDAETVENEYLGKYIYLVENDPSPLVRVYAEWLIASLLLKNHKVSLQIFTKLVESIENHELKPTLVTTYERILFLMIQAMDAHDEVAYLTKFISIIIPAASTNKAVTRHFSMSLATSVHQEIRTKKLVLEPGLQTIVDNMHRSALATDGFGQFRSGDALLWNIVDDMTLVNLSGGLLLRLFDREVDFLTKQDFDQYLSKYQRKILTHPVGENHHDLWVRVLKHGAKSDLQELSEGALSPLQTKSGAWSTVMDVDQGGPEVVRSDLVVVASLVDKPPNLGGICRLCDVLGAGTMTIHDSKVRKHPQFKNVAVTADHWMNMIEVPPSNLVKYLLQKKIEGYTLIGLEQTDKSVVLDSQVKFPKKSLILLGREKEGIPGELLAELDFCVEINQVGVVRSMNIQTATAVIVHAYSSQHC